MGFNNGYESGYEDAKAELMPRIRALEAQVAEFEAGGGGSAVPAGSTMLEVTPSAIVPSEEDPEGPGTSTIDLSGLAVGQTAYIKEPAGAFENQDAYFMVNLPVGVTKVKIPFTDSYLDLAEGVHSILSDSENTYLGVTGLGNPELLLKYFAVRTSETELYLFFVDGATP